MEPVNKVNPYEMLRKRFPLTEYAMMHEVSNAPGFSRSRSADYVIMNLWPSRGLSIIGIEQKASRSDWLSELKKPEKAESIFKFCDQFYLYTTNSDIAKIEEIPATWGWISIKGAKIVTMKEAPKNTPQPLTKGFVACMLKRACGETELIHPDQIEDKVKERAEKIAEQNNRELVRCREELADLRRDIKLFEESSGIKIETRWNWQDNKKVGEAVKLIVNGGIESYKNQLERIKTHIQGVESSIGKILSELS